MNKPYIGITGFMSRAEVEVILSKLSPSNNHLLMVGVLASWKTLRDVPNKWPNRYPPVGKIANIFSTDPRALNLIHYHTDESETLLHDLCWLTDLGGKLLHGFQLNVKWPSPKILDEYRVKHPDKKLVLQIGGGALEEIKHSPIRMAVRVAMEYNDLADYLLIDPSGGFGRDLDIEKTLDYLRALKEADIKLTLGVAGGLNGFSVPALKKITDEFPELCLDAEGRLRDEQDTLDLKKTEHYLTESQKLFL
jgi:hypothetical protein